jgi:membrane dipeptidase
MKLSSLATLFLLLTPIVLMGCQSADSSDSPQAASQSIDDRAQELAEEHIIVDGHIDLPYRLLDFREDVADSTFGGDFDYPRAKAGGLDAPFMSIYIPVGLQDDPGASKARAEELINLVEGIADEHPDKFEMATSPDDVRRIAEAGKVALPMGMENGSGLEDDIDNVAYFYDRGIRYITLTHGKHNRIGDSSYDQEDDRWNGLSPFGEDVIAEMNRLGMMVDISHVTDPTANAVLDITEAPVIASHSSCRHFTPGWERNMSDELIRAVGENGGVVMISFGSSFLKNEYQDDDDPIRERIDQYLEENNIEEGSAEAVRYTERVRKANPIGTLADVADHIDHAVEIAGIDHVGLGSDYDGVFGLPEGLQDASMYPNLIAELLDRGYSEEDIQKILGGNALRVWEEVEQVAQTLQQD